MNIGVFDSGLGGLTIFNSLLKNLPEYNYVYLGDNARVPYGNRSQEVIYQFTKEAIDFLVKKNCLLIIIACNTSTATSLKKIQIEYIPKNYPNIKALGVIKPAVEELEEKKYRRIGIIGTKATINSKAILREINKVLPKTVVFQQACPLLVPYIEDSSRNKKILNLILNEYLAPLKNEKIEALLLGCTHYEIIQKDIEKIIGKKTRVISESKPVSEKLKQYLKKHPQLDKKLSKKRKVEYFFTDPKSDYKKLMKLFLNG